MWPIIHFAVASNIMSEVFIVFLSSAWNFPHYRFIIRHLSLHSHHNSLSTSITAITCFDLNSRSPFLAINHLPRSDIFVSMLSALYTKILQWVHIKMSLASDTLSRVEGTKLVKGLSDRMIRVSRYWKFVIGRSELTQRKVQIILFVSLLMHSSQLELYKRYGVIHIDPSLSFLS